MNRFARVTLTVSALSLGLLLAGCESFDPTSVFDAEIFNTKKKLPGDRKPVFPEGTPGVPQGVPQELVKGYQAPAEPDPQAQAAVEPAEPKAKPKPKPKPKLVAKPAEQSTPTPVTVRPSQAQSQPQAAPQSQWPEPPATQQRQPASGQWPGSAQPSAGGGPAWPDPPASR
jgi:outer membrane biosynthesis protein TonB